MPSVLEDIAQGEQFTDIPVKPVDETGMVMKGASAPRPVTPEVAAKLAESNKAMREAFKKKGLTPPPLAPGETEPVDPFAGETKVKPNPFAGEQEVPNPFKGERRADALDERTPQDLAKDPNFKIHDFIFANKDNIFSDPKRYQKALDTYRETQAEGTTLKKTVASVKKDTLPLLTDIIKSVPKRLENISDIAVAPLVDAVTMKMRGEALDPEKRDQWENMTEDAKEAAIAEAIAGTQTAVGSLQDMVRQGTRKLVGPAFDAHGKKNWRNISDDELKNELFKDLGWRETVERLSHGEGVKDLVDQGVTLNPENIKLLSLTDPITLVATGAGLKGVSLGGRVLFTAANDAGAQAAIKYLGNAAGQAASKGAQIAGRGAEVTGQVIGKAAHLPTFTAAGLGSGHFFKAMAAAGAAKAAGKIIEKGGTLLREIGEAGAGTAGREGQQLMLGLEQTTGAKVLNAGKTLASIAKPPVVGAIKGAAATAPLAFATDEPQGGLLGVGAVGGAIHGTVRGVKGAVAEAGAKRYFDPGQINWEKTESPGYDNFQAMNAVHDNVAATAPENAKNMVNSLREVLRPFGRKLFLVDDATYQKAIENDTIRANGGKPLTPEQQAAVANEAKTRGISKIFMADDKGAGEMVTLVKSAEDAPHEVSHILESVMAPEAREALHDAVREAYTPEELDALQKHYEQQLGRPVTPEEARSEYIADNWANLLYNTPLEDLGLPAPKRGFKQVMLDAAIGLGNALGADMTAGRKTPGLDLRPSYSLRKALVNASGDILSERNRLAAEQATAPEVKPATPEAPAQPVEVKPAAAEAAPAETKIQTPVEPATAEPAQGELNFEPSAKPEAAPEAPPPAPAPAEGQPTVRPTPQRKDVSARRAEVTNVDTAAKWAEDKPNKAAVEEINAAFDEGVGLKVEHSGARAEVFNPTEPERAAEVEAGRGLPPEERELHSKELRPTRWETMTDGTPQLIARSTDKVLANVDRAVQWAKASGEEVPWETDANGALTSKGVNDLLADLNTYWDNQDRGFRGGGETLVRPPAKTGASIPVERGEGVKLGDAKEQWLNLLQGKDMGPPVTARASRGQLPANIKAQEIRAAQGLPSERIAPGTDIQVYPAKATGGRGVVEIKETNPLRNRLRAAGMPVGDLHTVVERLNGPDITAATRAPELKGKGGSTDITRAGFLTEKPVKETVDEVFADTPDQWMKRFGPNNTLTKSAYELGLGLKDKADLEALRAAQAKASADNVSVMAEVKAGNFDKMDEAYALATKSQFFREAVEAATDTGSAAGEVGWRKAFPGREAPFSEKRGGALTAEPVPSEEVRKLADDYAKKAGISYNPNREFAAINPALSKRLADFYEQAKSSPNDPKVAASYKALADETIAQYRAMEEAGYTIEPYEGKGEPYKNSAEAVADIRDNKHLYFLRTEEAFGKDAAPKSDNPMLADSGVEINGHKLLVNDVFRAVHDFFGHGKEGYQFGPRGEFNAWRAHSEMFSPDAQGALAAETLAQNSWVNFGKHLRDEAGNIPKKGEKGYVGPTERPFAEQKNIVIPDELIQEARGGYLPKKRTARETEEAARKRVEETDYSKYNTPATAKTDKPTGWVLPNGKFVALDTDYHQSWLGENADSLNKEFGTSFGTDATVEDRLAALNKGFVRAREYGGKLMVEANQKFYKGAQKRAIEDLLDRNAEGVDRVTVSLLNDEGQVTDSVSAKLFDADDPRQEISNALDKLNPRQTTSKKGPSAIQIARSRGDYLTKEKLTPKTAEAAAKAHNDDMTSSFPEALPTRFIRDAKGKLKLQQGKLVPADEEAVLDKTPLALDAVRDNPDAKPADAISDALSDKIVDEAQAALKNPDVAKGLTWYDDAVALIKKYFGKDAGLFAQLLAATSPQNGVQTNFLYAIDAWNAAKRGEYDHLIQKYKAAREQWKTGGPDVDEWVKETEGRHKPDSTVVGLANRNNFLSWYVDKNDMLPKRAEGKLYGMHSFPVLDVLSGTWLEDVGGPKVRNFLKNLTGEGHEATIDIWATRFLMRLAQSEDSLKGRWRVAPPAGWGISAENFDVAQAAFRKAAKKMGTQPDALQALVWFHEKHLWEDNNWTKMVGAAKSDYAYWLRGLEPGETPETYNISAAAKAEAKRQGQTTGKKKRDKNQAELDIPLHPSED